MNFHLDRSDSNPTKQTARGNVCFLICAKYTNFKKNFEGSKDVTESAGRSNRTSNTPSRSTREFEIRLDRSFFAENPLPLSFKVQKQVNLNLSLDCIRKFRDVFRFGPTHFFRTATGEFVGKRAICQAPFDRAGGDLGAAFVSMETG